MLTVFSDREIYPVSAIAVVPWITGDMSEDYPCCHVTSMNTLAQPVQTLR